MGWPDIEFKQYASCAFRLVVLCMVYNKAVEILLDFNRKMHACIIKAVVL